MEKFRVFQLTTGRLGVKRSLPSFRQDKRSGLALCNSLFPAITIPFAAVKSQVTAVSRNLVLKRRFSATTYRNDSGIQFTPEENDCVPWYLWTITQAKPWRLNLNDNRFLTWGFIEQDSKVMEQTRDRHQNSLHTFTHTKTHGQSVEDELSLLDFHQISPNEFSDGAKLAYRFLAECFSRRDTNISEYDVTTPRLATVFEGVAQVYLDNHLQPILDIDYNSLSVKILGVWIETGSSDKKNKVFGRFDVSELKHYCLSGFLGPEYALESEQLGLSPRRLVVAIQFDLLESFHIADSGSRVNKDGSINQTEDGTPLECSHNSRPPNKTRAQHFWVLETDVGKPSNSKKVTTWRVRNINDAILPSEGEKIPKCCF